MELLKGEEQRLSGCLCPHLKSDLRHAHEDALAHTSSVMHVFIAILPRKSISLHLFTADIHLHSLNIEIYSIEYTHTQTYLYASKYMGLQTQTPTPRESSHTNQLKRTLRF